MSGTGRRLGFRSAALALISVALVAMPVFAEPSVAISKATLESKTRLISLLLAQSPAVKRIPQSDNVQARKKLANAQALYANAEAEAERGRVEQAIKLLDQALLDIVTAARLVPDTAQQEAQERANYDGLRESVRIFMTLQRSVSRKMAGKKFAVPDMARVEGMTQKAEGLAAAANYIEANRILSDAYKEVVSAINKMLIAETIVYDLKFDSPADEFHHELARTRSYEELIPLALKQFNPSRETRLLSERHAQRSRELSELAQKQAGGGDYLTALKTIRDATGQLQRSLQIAGLVVPQSQEGITP